MMKHAAVICIGLLVGVAGARADVYKYTFRDVLKPHGVARGLDAQHAAARACGAAATPGTYGGVTGYRMPANIPAYKRCMRAHGWTLARVEVRRTPQSAAPQSSGAGDFFGALLGGSGRTSQEQDDVNFWASRQSQQLMDEQIREETDDPNVPTSPSYVPPPPSP
jgi:hypothetical protein